MSSSQNLVRMANDIGNFFRAQPSRDDAITGIENHIRSFWTRRMCEKIFAQLDQQDIGLDDLPKEALLRLKSHPQSKTHEEPGGDAG